MTYQLGVDLGTTYTAAAVHRDGRTEMVTLGNRAPSTPTVVYLGPDATFLIGEAANRRAVTEPGRVAREFKRRVGDPTPVLLGGTPLSADALMARVLAGVVEEATEAQGGPPDLVAVTHPANWGEYKLDLLLQAARAADLEDVLAVPEPVAAAVHYATSERIDPGELVAVFDLGGGTFDAAVLRRTPASFELLGRPEGIERLGGIDFDQAVLAHVSAALDGALEEVDTEDPTALAALARLRQDCVEAKEALSEDTEVSIPVLLPGLQTEVRLTRAELEAMIRPALADAIAALRRALRSAEVAPEALTAVLLVGGSSRIPLVAEMVGAELRRPVAVDAHPKHAVALGAAILAGQAAAGRSGRASGAAAASTEAVAAAAPAGSAPPAAAGGAQAAAPAPEAAAAAGSPAATPAPAAGGTDDTRVQAPVEGPAAEDAAASGAGTPPPAGPASPHPSATAATKRGRGRVVAIAAAAAAVAAVALVGVAVAGGGGGDGPRTGEGAASAEERAGDEAGGGSEPTAVTTTEAAGADGGAEPATTAPATTTPPTTEAAATTAFGMPLDRCPLPDGGPTACVEDVRFDGDELVVDFSVHGVEPFLSAGELPPESRHLHFFFDTTDPADAGTQSPTPGAWKIWDDRRPYRGPRNEVGGEGWFAGEIPDGATAVCVLVADARHRAIQGTGNCGTLPPR